MVRATCDACVKLPPPGEPMGPDHYHPAVKCCTYLPVLYNFQAGALLYDRTSSTKTLELEDGRVIAVSSQPIAEGGWVVTHEDITERQRAVKELERTRNFYNTVLENVPASIIVKDADRVICWGF